MHRALALALLAACSSSNGGGGPAGTGGLGPDGSVADAGGLRTGGRGGGGSGGGGSGGGGSTMAAGGTGAGGAAGDARTSTPDAAPTDATTADTAVRDATARDTARDVALDVPADNRPSDVPGDHSATGDLSPSPDAGAERPDGACAPPAAGIFATSATHLDVGVHDPSVLSDGKRFYLFATGGSLSIRSSSNGLQWSSAGKVFPSVPAWVTSSLGTSAAGFELWAPDVSFFGCKYHVYYAGSTFGSNTSVIGLATSASLDPDSPDYGWKDEGVVVSSKSSDNYNAIDPHVAFDEAGTPWLSFGSFWDGIKMRRLDPATGKPSAQDTTLYSLASRKGTGDAIEAPSIIAYKQYYYLFVSFDACCKGVDSTYRTMVGRATAITGPYADKAGKAMTRGAAEQLLGSSGRYIGPGGGTAFRNGDGYYYAFHYYDGNDRGTSKLQIRPIEWTADDWPTLGQPIFP